MPAIQTPVKDTIKEVQVESKLSEPTKIVSPTPAVAKDIPKLDEAPKDVQSPVQNPPKEADAPKSASPLKQILKDEPKSSKEEPKSTLIVQPVKEAPKVEIKPVSPASAKFEAPASPVKQI